MGPGGVTSWIATELKHFGKAVFEAGRLAALGRRWGKQFLANGLAAIYMVDMAFSEGVTSLRNAGVTGSSPVGGTIPSTRHANSNQI